MTLSLAFYGAAQLTDWYFDPVRCQSYKVVIGDVQILTEKEIGFHLRTSGNANYAVRVQGPSGQAVVLPGCKVYSVTALPTKRSRDNAPVNVYVVP
jgi:hypothetical protein